MNALQYIDSMYHQKQTGGVNFMVSGVDPWVRQMIGQHLVNTAYETGRILFIVDNTKRCVDFADFGRFRVLNPLNGEADLCHDFLEVSSLKEISRLRSLLTGLGFEGIKAMKVINYLLFVRETENHLGNSAPLRAETLEEYGSIALVEWKLRNLLESKKISDENYEYLISRYAEISDAAADFEGFLVMLAPLLCDGCQPTAGNAIRLPFGEFSDDRLLQEVLCKLMLSFVKKQPDDCAVLILDDSKCNRECIVGVLNTVPNSTEIHFLTTDAFASDEEELNLLMNTFPVRIYSRHENMSSCGKIENCCGQIDVVKRSYSTTVDKRIRASSAFDMLLGTNRTEAEIRNAPVREARFRKEIINSLSPGAAIIDCGGTQTLFQF